MVPGRRELRGCFGEGSEAAKVSIFIIHGIPYCHILNEINK
jgi:hypothetical protein